MALINSALLIPPTQTSFQYPLDLTKVDSIDDLFIKLRERFFAPGPEQGDWFSGYKFNGP